MRFTLQTITSVLRATGALLGVILTLATITPSYAAGGAGVLNTTFGRVQTTCNLNYWTANSAVTAVKPEGSILTGAFKTCSALLKATATTNNTKLVLPTTATLEQSFMVDPSDTMLRLYVAADSSYSTEPYPGPVPTAQKAADSIGADPVQTISLYASNGALIYSKSHNTFGTYLFEYDLSAYASTTVKIRFKTDAAPLLGYQTTSEVKLAVNFYGADDPSPEGELPRW